jgi:hypothetical protein
MAQLHATDPATSKLLKRSLRNNYHDFQKAAAIDITARL